MQFFHALNTIPSSLGLYQEQIIRCSDQLGRASERDGTQSKQKWQHTSVGYQSSQSSWQMTPSIEPFPSKYQSACSGHIVSKLQQVHDCNA